MIQDCEGLSIDYDWSLTRKSACHIANQNAEMGELRDSQLEMSYRMDAIELYITLNTWLWAAIAAAIIGVAIKNIFISPQHKI